MLFDIASKDSISSPPRRRLSSVRASASETDMNASTRARCWLDCPCSASFLRFSAVIGVVSGSAAYWQSWPFPAHAVQLGRLPSHFVLRPRHLLP